MIRLLLLCVALLEVDSLLSRSFLKPSGKVSCNERSSTLKIHLCSNSIEEGGSTTSTNVPVLKESPQTVKKTVTRASSKKKKKSPAQKQKPGTTVIPKKDAGVKKKPIARKAKTKVPAPAQSSADKQTKMPIFEGEGDAKSEIGGGLEAVEPPVESVESFPEYNDSMEMDFFGSAADTSTPSIELDLDQTQTKKKKKKKFVVTYDDFGDEMETIEVEESESSLAANTLSKISKSAGGDYYDDQMELDFFQSEVSVTYEDNSKKEYDDFGDEIGDMDEGEGEGEGADKDKDKNRVKVKRVDELFYSRSEHSKILRDYMNSTNDSKLSDIEKEDQNSVIPSTNISSETNAMMSSAEISDGTYKLIISILLLLLFSTKLPF